MLTNASWPRAGVEDQVKHLQLNPKCLREFPAVTQESMEFQSLVDLRSCMLKEKKYFLSV